MRTAIRSLVFLIVLACALAGEHAHAQMTLLEDGRRLYARAVYHGVPQEATQTPDFPGEQWMDAFAAGYVEEVIQCPPPSEPGDTCTVGSASSDAHQWSLFFPAGIQINGVTAGTWTGEPSGTYEFESLARFRFRIRTACDYTLYAQVQQGDWASVGMIGGYVKLVDARSGITLKYLESGALSDTSRIGPGDYILEGNSYGYQWADSWQGTVYFAQWTVDSIPQPLIGHQPDDQTVGCGGTAMFSVSPAAGAGAVTYQWRRNLVPLSSGGQIAGATSATLTISNACTSDAGYYDVVVTSATAQEPSRLAQLTAVSSPTGVEETSSQVAGPLSVVFRGPNPFRESTSFSYKASAARPTRVTVYNVAGARMKTLVDGAVSSFGTVEWDGRLASGMKAPAGIYFVRVESGPEKWNGRIVLLE
ncbi:MAG TPA: FlgD immunoglobulin-like domain containing protein [Candidatus Eisenbacteria bacterium]